MKIHLKTLIVCITISVLLVGCGGGTQGNVSVNSASATPVATKEAEKPTPTATIAPVTEDTARPVEYTYAGLTPSKDGFSYKIKVNSAKPISQVDIGVKYMDAGGKVLEETTIAWQNIVKSARKAIERGKTYEAEGYLPEGATRVESTLKRVIFTDGTRWEAK